MIERCARGAPRYDIQPAAALRAEAAREAADRAAARQTAHAREARRRSRAARSGLDGSAAGRLARETFPADLQAPVWQGLRLRVGERVRS